MSGPEGDGDSVRRLGQALQAVGRGLSAAASDLSGQLRALIPSGWSGAPADAFSSDWGVKAGQAGQLAAVCSHVGGALVDLGNAIDAANQQASSAQQMTGGPASRFALPSTEQKSQQLLSQAGGAAGQARAAARGKLAGIAVPRIGPPLTVSAVNAWAQHLAPPPKPPPKPASHGGGGLLGDIGSFFSNTVLHGGEHLLGDAGQVLGDAGHVLGDAGHVAGKVLDGAGHFAEGFLWDGAVGTLKGLGDLVGMGPLWGDPSFLHTWKGIALLAQPFATPGYVSPQSMAAWEGFGKSLLDWNEWKKDPGRAAGDVMFNVVTAPFVASKVLEAGTAAKAAAGAGEAGAAAADAGKAGDAGRAAADTAGAAKTADGAQGAKAADPVAAAAASGPAWPKDPVLRQAASDLASQAHADGLSASQILDQVETLETLATGKGPASIVRFPDTKPMDPQFSNENIPEKSPWGPGRAVKYLDATQREQLRLTVRNGLLYDANGNLFDTRSGGTLWSGEGRAIFVVDENGNIYASTFQQAGFFHHSSILAGRPVAGAGELQVVDGRLELISDNSGHYTPTRQYTQQTVNYLRSLGISIDDGQIEFHAPGQ